MAAGIQSFYADVVNRLNLDRGYSAAAEGDSRLGHSSVRLIPRDWHQESLRCAASGGALAASHKATTGTSLGCKSEETEPTERWSRNASTGENDPFGHDGNRTFSTADGRK